MSVEELTLHGLKSHDYHALMQQLLPVAIRSVLPKHVRYAITRLCFFFNALCAKVVDVSKLNDLQCETPRKSNFLKKGKIVISVKI